MSLMFEEIDSQPSALGRISLRRRRIPAFGDRDIYEVKLGEEFLMSSMFVDAEIALADLALAMLDGDQLHVVVGGLGLGYTAEAALQHASVADLRVVDALDTVIRWHQQEKAPLGKSLNQDPRCHYVHGSFFAMALTGFDNDNPGRLFDAILLDIDHSPRALLHHGNASFYQADSLGRMAGQLRDGGVFAMWSNEPPDDDFSRLLAQVFGNSRAEIVSFYNPLQNNMAANTVYLSQKS
ncbi:MAG TPA: spermidine synthase [Pseudomonadales bacterium]